MLCQEGSLAERQGEDVTCSTSVRSISLTASQPTASHAPPACVCTWEESNPQSFEDVVKSSLQRHTLLHSASRLSSRRPRCKASPMAPRVPPLSATSMAHRPAYPPVNRGTGLNPSESLSFPLFNPSLGTLTSVTFTLGADAAPPSPLPTRRAIPLMSLASARVERSIPLRRFQSLL